jgi:succinate dehydrogenase/fumarate reductase flavoprotein subunit
VGVSGSAIIKRQLLKLNELGIKVRTHTYFKTFIRDSEGIIIGALVRNSYSYKNSESGIDKQIGIRKGIVLATGGFGSDVSFRSTQDPRLTKDIDTTNKPFTTAEALKEAIKIKAMPVQISHIQLGPWGTPDEKGYGVGARFSDYIVFPYGIIVEPDSGERIVNELADRKTISDAILNTGHPCIGITDAKAVEATGWKIEPCLGKGIVKQFDQLEELALCYGIAPSALKHTIEQYNDYIEGEFDKEFGKQILPSASPISTPPYYGIRTWPKVHYTMGGAQINTEARVIDVD